MTQTGFGAALRSLRDRRMLSTRELGKLSDIDHAYIYRLETGEKSSPSPELIQKLLAVLKANERETAMVNWLADHQNANPDLVKYVLDDPSIEFELFTMAAGVRHRGTGRPDPSSLIKRIRIALQAAEES
ncbi:MAG: helix-turn-helix domain-containing protein [Candidatus Berkelbacteria bacterium]|nr:helix-turn-helix domain-containing protein [Candidatus Berkelbacteria bacterium]